MFYNRCCFYQIDSLQKDSKALSLSICEHWATSSLRKLPISFKTCILLMLSHALCEPVKSHRLLASQLCRPLLFTASKINWCQSYWGFDMLEMVYLIISSWWTFSRALRYERHSARSCWSVLEGCRKLQANFWISSGTVSSVSIAGSKEMNLGKTRPNGKGTCLAKPQSMILNIS